MSNTKPIDYLKDSEIIDYLRDLVVSEQLESEASTRIMMLVDEINDNEEGLFSGCKWAVFLESLASQRNGAFELFESRKAEFGGREGQY